MRPIFSCLLAMLTFTASAENWSRFRGESASGVAGQGVPTTWSNTKNLAWRTELPGKGSRLRSYGTTRHLANHTHRPPRHAR